MDGLEEGRIYTVLDVTTWFCPPTPEDNGDPIVRLFEIKREGDGYRFVTGVCRIGFGVWRFRPLSERKTDISVFQHETV